MRTALAAMLLLVARAAIAQDALVVAASADHLRGGSGGGATLLWLHPDARDTFVAGATFLSLPSTRWAYATLGDTRRLDARTFVNAEANLGAGDDPRGSFPYLLVRAGLARELVAKRVTGEAEWLQTDVARQQQGIARLGAAWTPARSPLTLRASAYRSLFGDGETSLGTVRADYLVGRATAIAGASFGTAIPALVEQPGPRSARVREAFGGVAFDAVARRWTVILSSTSVGGEHRARLAVSCRLPLAWRASRKP